jgi:hypothetical protein
MNEIVARYLIEYAKTVRDPERLKHLTVQAFSESFGSSGV